MSKQEAAFFYGDYSELAQEFKEMLLAENVEATSTHEEISS